jgi:UDP-glucose 4-epimerase
MGAGFIGSHVVDALIKQGYQVVVVDNLSTGRLENVNPAATFYQLDIYNSELEGIFEKESPELVNHQAAQMVIRKSMEDPVFDARQNILGSLNLYSAISAVWSQEDCLCILCGDMWRTRISPCR